MITSGRRRLVEATMVSLVIAAAGCGGNPSGPDLSLKPEVSCVVEGPADRVELRLTYTVAFLHATASQRVDVLLDGDLPPLEAATRSETVNPGETQLLAV